jgi:hypothetical protein
MIKDKYSGMFLQEDSGGDMGGGAGEQSSPGAAVFESGDGGSAPSKETAQQPQRAAPSGAEARVDARELAQEFGHVIGQHFQQQPKAEPQMSVEEAKRLLNVWEPSQEWLSKYDNLESRIPALVDMRDGFIKQADTIAQYRMNEMMQRMQQTYAPVIQYMQTQEAKAGEWRFREKFPELAHDNMRPLLYAVSQNLLAQGIPFRSEEELFSAIATGVEAVIKVNNPEFKLGGNGAAASAPVKQQHYGRPQAGGIPVTTPGSGGVSGGRGGAGPPKPRGLAVFE